MSLKTRAWSTIAKILSNPRIAPTVIKTVKYFGGKPTSGPAAVNPLCMNRWWAFNDYRRDPATGAVSPPAVPWLPTIRLQRLYQPDEIFQEYDVPWNSRRVLLSGWYVEEREFHNQTSKLMAAGDTDNLSSGVFHRIVQVSRKGAYTLFVTKGPTEVWGFMVDGKKVPWWSHVSTAKNTVSE